MGEQFNEELKKDIAKLNSTFEEYQLSYYMSKLLNGKIQVVLASSTKYVDEINEIANTIHSLLTSCKLLLIIINNIILSYIHIYRYTLLINVKITILINHDSGTRIYTIDSIV